MNVASPSSLLTRLLAAQVITFAVHETDDVGFLLDHP
jgi:hypothetical protein